MSDAKIIGFDLRMCMCCGGTEIVIDNLPNPNGNSFFLINNMPSEFSLGNNPTFPIAVKINWQTNSKCFGNYIDITKITRK